MQKMMIRATTVAIAATIMLAGATSAFADNDKGRGNGHGKGKVERSDDRDDDHGNYRRDKGDNDVWVSLSILTDDRSRIERYFEDDYKRHCPPGLAKKRNGCLPPGQAKKYRVGDRLPDGIFIPLPDDLISVLRPAPRGHQYVRVDRDVYLISEAGHKIIDAVTLLSSVGN